MTGRPSRARRYAEFWLDFVVGDDWRLAAAVVAALLATYALSRADVRAWWLVPVIIMLSLGWSLRRAIRATKD